MMDIHHITLRTIAQATESEERVKKALSLFLFDDDIESIKTKGHFKNPLTILQATIKGKQCRQFIKGLKSQLSAQELERLKTEINDRVDDDCTLHIRFDKQAAYQGSMQMAATLDTISVRIKIKAYPSRRENAIAVAEQMFSK